MKRSLTLLILLLILSLIALPIFLIRYITPHTQTNASNTFYLTHILGGFSIETPQMATKAAADGIQVFFKYGYPPSETSKLGQKLKSLHMKVIDGYIWDRLYNYECYRIQAVKPIPLAVEQYCVNVTYPYITDENILLSAVTDYLKQVKDNTLIIGFWVLDDWVSWDAGSARQLLIKIHHLIQQYTPGRPAICGFGGSITSDHTSGWDDWIAENFSPQGCDKVGLYIYAPSLPDTTPSAPPDAYDWSMSTVLPAMFASLHRRGWDITKEPLIGIGQAFGGPRASTDSYWITPTAKDIETQSRSFCEHGATGLTFYAWNDSGFGPTTHTPINSPEIEMGIRNSIAACKQYWSHHSQNDRHFKKKVAWSSLIEYVERKRRYRCSPVGKENSCSILGA